MSGPELAPDPMIELGRLLAASLAFGSTASELRALANRINNDPRAAERAGRLLGQALALYATKGEP